MRKEVGYMMVNNYHAIDAADAFSFYINGIWNKHDDESYSLDFVDEINSVHTKISVPEKLGRKFKKMIVNKNASVFIKRNDEKIILYKDTYDSNDPVFALLYAYFLDDVGYSKTRLHKLFDEFDSGWVKPKLKKQSETVTLISGDSISVSDYTVVFDNSLDIDAYCKQVREASCGKKGKSDKKKC